MSKIVSFNSQDLEQIRKGLVQKLPSLSGKKVMILGDVGLDEYVMGKVRRISPEAPVPVLEVTEQDRRLGLAANVAQNVASLGGEPLLLAVVGQDESRDQLSTMLERARVSPKHLIEDPSRPTTRKLRAMTGHHHIVRVDYEQKRFLSSEMEDKLLALFEEKLEECVGVILEDYAKGVLSERVCQAVVEKAKARGVKVLVDPHPSTPSRYYKGAAIMTPNREEALQLSGLNFDDLREKENSLFEVGEQLLEQIEADHLVITRGKEGMTLFEPGHITNLPTYARQVFDVAGAGDTVIAALALAWAAEWPLVEACVLANFAAGVAVSKVGCVPCHTEELIEYINTHSIEFFS